MKITKVSNGITQLSTNVENILFEGLWQIPEGVTLNSYIVKGKETAIIDGFCGWDGVPESFFKLLKELDIDIKSIKYLILNHLEPDHSGWIDELRKIHNDFEVICSDKGAELYNAFFGEGSKIRVVKDGDELDLGDGKKLSFYTIPNVHWPDTIATYESESGILFPCDAFGSFGTFEKSHFDADYTDEEIASFEKETIRYYSNIVAAFSMFVTKAINKCRALDIKMIAPGHGLMWNKRVEKIIKDYADYANYQKGNSREEITLLWGSMYGMTERAAKVAEEELKKSGIKYHVHQVPQTNWGEMLTSLWTSSGVILGMPTYEYKMFPPMASILEEAGKKKVQGRKALRFGSYGWSGGAQKELDEIVEKNKMNWTFIEPVEFRGQPSDEDLETLRSRVRDLIASVRQ